MVKLLLVILRPTIESTRLMVLAWKLVFTSLCSFSATTGIQESFFAMTCILDLASLSYTAVVFELKQHLVCVVMATRCCCHDVSFLKEVKNAQPTEKNSALFRKELK